MFLTSTEESHLVRKSFSVVITNKILNSNQEPQEKEWPLYSLLPVSYTHLDVYKRQVIFSTINLEYIYSRLLLKY